MARTKGMLNLSGNLEVNAQAPLDARTIVPTEADLTVASNFPYPYVGLEVYVTGTGKKFRLINLDTTQSSSWHEVFEGGGGSGLPSGGTAGQYLVKQSATEGDAGWQSLSAFTGATSQDAGAAGLVPAPQAGDEGKVLFGDGSWGNIVMPSVDYSQQSVEANIYSTTEKVVGQWTNGKLLYQKIFSQSISNEETIIDIGATVDYLDVMGSTFEKDGYIYNPYILNDGMNKYFKINGFLNSFSESAYKNKIKIKTNSTDWLGSNVKVVARYTKTTDSPLASGEKFAGVTSSGEVVYEKHITGLNVSLDTSNWNTVCNIPNVSIVIDAIAYYNNNGTGLKNTVIFKEIEPNANGDIKAEVTNSRTINEITIRYTKSS